MSITGRFEADFQSFYTAVDKANVKMADFQTGASKVESALNRMVDNFSGRKLIQEVTLSVEALQRLRAEGKKLTDDELQKLAAKATEAVAKMKAMGIEVPPGIQRVANALRPVREEIGLLDSGISKIGPAIAGAFAVGKVVEFALNVGKAQQQLARLSAETQIGVEELQTLTIATRGYGLSNDELARALFNVSKGIAGGDESIARGLHKAGISLDEIRDKRGKELFLDIERGLSTLQGSLRDTAAADIFGSKLGAAMAGFAREADAAVAAAEKLNSKLSAEEVENLKRYADEVEKLQHQFTTLRDRVVVGGIDTIHALGLKFREGSASVRDFFSAITGGSGTANMDKLRENTAALSADLAKAKAEQDRLNASQRESVSESSKEYQALQFLTALRTDSAKALESYQRRGLEDLRAMGQLNQQNAAAIGVSVDQFKKYTEEVRIAEVQTKSLTAAEIERGAQLSKISSTITSQLVQQRGTQTQIELAAIKQAEDAEILSLQRRADALKNTLISQRADTKENLDKIDADTKDATDQIKGHFGRLREGVGVDWNEIRSNSQENLDDIRDRALKTLLEARATAGITREEIDKLTDKYREAAFNATAMGRNSVEATREAAKGAIELQTAFRFVGSAIDAANTKVVDLSGKIVALSEILATERAIAEGKLYTVDPFGNRKIADDQTITTQQFGRVTPIGENANVKDLEREIFRLTKAIAEYDPTPRTAFGVQAELNIQRQQQHLDQMAQLEYLKTMVQLLQSRNSLSSFGSSGDALLPPSLRSGGGDVSINVSVPISVSGVLDDSASRQLADNVGAEFMKRLKQSRLLRLG